MKKYAIQIRDDNEIELEITKKQNLNDLFAELTEEGVTVTSFRNKSSRLEALFMTLLNK